MVSRIQSLASFLMVLTLLLFAGSATAQNVSPRCEAAMDRAAGHYSQCLLRADAHHARHGNATKLEGRQTRCQTRFDRRTTRAINRHGADQCPLTSFSTEIRTKTQEFTTRVASEAGGESFVEYLFVQSAERAILLDNVLTLRADTPRP